MTLLARDERFVHADAASYAPTLFHPHTGVEAVTGSLVLRNDGDGWAGTFQVLLRTLFTDLLPEGPVAVWVAVEPGSDVLVFSGTVASLDGWTLRFVDGYHLELGNVLALGL